MKNHCINTSHPKREALARGLCPACYSSAIRLVSQHKTTWEALESTGRSLPLGAKRKGPAKWLLKTEVA